MLDLGVELSVDFFALSFAREPAHIQHLELLLQQKNCPARVIAQPPSAASHLASES